MTDLIPSHFLTPTKNRIFDDFKAEFEAGNIGLYLAKAESPEQAMVSINAQSTFYPASLCKLFYLACFLSKVEQKELVADDEDWRAVDNMVSLSSNDATSYVLNRLCNTSTGATLTEPQLTPWIEKRKSVQRWLATHCPQISPKQYHLYHATFDESPYGRDQQARDILGSNQLSPLACAQMMASLFLDENLLPDHLTKTKRLLSKNSGQNRFSFDGVDQVTQFIGGALPKGATYWSKAGWTSQVKHETAYVFWVIVTVM